MQLQPPFRCPSHFVLCHGLSAQSTDEPPFRFASSRSSIDSYGITDIQKEPDASKLALTLLVYPHSADNPISLKTVEHDELPSNLVSFFPSYVNHE